MGMVSLHADCQEQRSCSQEEEGAKEPSREAQEEVQESQN